MRYATANAFRTALEQRLLTTARESGITLAQLRKLVAFDRFLARLMAVAPDRWILKGAVALHFRLGARFRGTRDLDLGRWDSELSSTADLLAAQQIDLGDYFRFIIERTTKLDALLEGAAMRFHVSVYLASRPFEEVTVDVGFGDSPVVDPERLRGRPTTVTGIRCSSTGSRLVELLGSWRSSQPAGCDAPRMTQRDGWKWLRRSGVGYGRP
jgi:Nucleotidyl transferase AbiEii toxin, Type IV TA system